MKNPELQGAGPTRKRRCSAIFGDRVLIPSQISPANTLLLTVTAGLATALGNVTTNLRSSTLISDERISVQVSSKKIPSVNLNATFPRITYERHRTPELSVGDVPPLTLQLALS